VGVSRLIVWAFEVDATVTAYVGLRGTEAS
jgi:hypothetical protein